jgi:cephalosporin hydroxylase
MIRIDIDNGVLEVDDGDTVQRLDFSDPRAFEIVSRAWLRIGWDTKYVYGFTWLGRPIIQLPEDLVRIQEAIHRIKPDVIVETGVAHGGSLVFYASLCKAMGKGRVIGVDVEIRPHNRAAIEAHELAPHIRLVEGDSVDPAIVRQVRTLIRPGETTLILLDSKHTKAHVLAELRAYGPMVSVGSYIVACDGIMEQLVAAPRSQPDWAWNNPKQAALEFAAECPEFVHEAPAFPFNEGAVTQMVSYWHGGWLRRVASVRAPDDRSGSGSSR